MVALQAEGLRAAGHKVFIITTKPWRHKTPSIERETIYYLNSIYHYQYKLPKPTRILLHLNNMVNIDVGLRIMHILKKEVPDLVIGHNMLGLSFLIPRLVENMGIKYVQVLHDIQLLHPSGLMLWGEEQTIDSSLAKIYQSLTRRLVSATAYLVSPSKWLLELHKSKGFFTSSRVKVLPNPMMRSGNILRRPAKGEFSFLFAGRISEDKGAYLLIDTFIDLISEQSVKGITLTMIGDDPRPLQTKKLINKQKGIKFLGQQDHAAVLRAMQGTDCLIVPSLCYENSPAVIYEALSYGRRVIAADLGGIKELGVHKGVELIVPGSVKELKKKMLEVIKTAPRGAIVDNSKLKILDPQEYVNTILSFVNQTD